MASDSGYRNVLDNWQQNRSTNNQTCVYERRIRMAQNSDGWHQLKEAYTQQWANSGCNIIQYNQLISITERCYVLSLLSGLEQSNYHKYSGGMGRNENEPLVYEQTSYRKKRIDCGAKPKSHLLSLRFRTFRKYNY